MLAANISNPARERLTLIRLFEELRALGYEAAMTLFAAMPVLEPGAREPDGGGLCAAVVCAGRSLPVRLTWACRVKSFF